MAFMSMKLQIAAPIFLILTMSSLCGGESPPVTTEDTLFKVAKSLKMFVDELPQMPKILGYGPSLSPGRLTIGMYPILWKFHRDFPATPVFAYGTSKLTASVPGPLIEAMKDTPTYVTWKNYLPKKHILPWDPTIPTAIPKNGGVPTVVHLHGGIQPPQSDGSALAWFTSNFSETGPAWTQTTYYYPNVQHAGNLWYHDHALGLTRVNLLAGLIAPYIIKDKALDAKLNLPSGPEFDRVLMVFDRSFNVDGSLYINRTGNNPTIHPQWQPEYFGDAIIVNGKAWPYLKVQRRKYRFRIINSSNARYYNFSLTNDLPFTIVGSDASYLPYPVKSNTILLAPAESVDVIIDFSLSATSESILQNSAAYPYPSGSLPDQLNGKIMKFIIQGGHPTTKDTSSIPHSCKAYYAIQKPSVTRYIALYEYTSPTDEPTHLLINGKKFTDPATEKPRVGSTEIWEVINLTEDNHPLHIHLAEFQAIKRRQLVDLEVFKACMIKLKDAIACNVTGHATGAELEIPAYEKTWKNVVKMQPGYVTTIIVKFNLVQNDGLYPFDATAEPGYVYHCHILDHEDNQMIRPLKLVH